MNLRVKRENFVREASVVIPTKADFEAMNRPQGDGSLQALCNLPCGQVCVSCSCHAGEQQKEEETYRF